MRNSSENHASVSSAGKVQRLDFLCKVMEKLFIFIFSTVEKTAPPGT